MMQGFCETCKYHKHIYTHVYPFGDDIRMRDGWVCVNENSKNAGEYTDYRDKCDKWEERHGRK